MYIYIYILNIYIYQCILYIYVYTCDCISRYVEHQQNTNSIYGDKQYGIHGDMYQHIRIGQSRTAGGKQKKWSYFVLKWVPSGNLT